MDSNSLFLTATLAEYIQVEDQAWLRHRRVTAPPFNENNNSLVWIESLSQARQMVKYWEAKKTVTTLAQDAKTFSLHVLSSAGFGKSYPFDSWSDTVRGEHSYAYKESLFLILENVILILVLGPKLLSNQFLQIILPSHWVRVGQATVDYKAYMAETIEEEKNLLAQGKQSRDNLMTALIKSSSEAEKGQSLTEAEIFGNMFVFNFAGHDTTANTLAYGFILLAAHPNVQSWISEEIRHVCGGTETSALDYRKTFPKLKRCLAVLVDLPYPP